MEKCSRNGNEYAKWKMENENGGQQLSQIQPIGNSAPRILGPMRGLFSVWHLAKRMPTIWNENRFPVINKKYSFFENGKFLQLDKRNAWNKNYYIK